MLNVKGYHLWGVSLLFLISFRWFSGSLFTEGALVGGLLYVIAFYHWVVPFVCGKDMQLIRFTDTFKKGTDDTVRYLLFGIGLFGYYVALVA